MMNLASCLASDDLGKGRVALVIHAYMLRTVDQGPTVIMFPERMVTNSSSFDGFHISELSSNHTFAWILTT